MCYDSKNHTNDVSVWISVQNFIFGSLPIFRDREWDLGVTKVTPDFWKSHSRNGSRNGSRHGSRIIGIGSEKSGVRNLEISLSRIGIEESGVTWKKPLPNPLPIPIGSQNFAHWMSFNIESGLLNPTGQFYIQFNAVIVCHVTMRMSLKEIENVSCLRIKKNRD